MTRPLVATPYDVLRAVRESLVIRGWSYTQDVAATMGQPTAVARNAINRLEDVKAIKWRTWGWFLTPRGRAALAAHDGGV